MTKTKKFSIILLLLSITVSLYAGEGRAKTPQPWLNYSRATAYLRWVITTEESRNEIEGTFSVRLPDGFSFSYQMDNQLLKRVVGYRNFTAAQFQGRTVYGYQSFPLFDIVQNFFHPIAYLDFTNLVWASDERMAQRDVNRYTLKDDPQTIYWIDQQTGLPLLIRSANETVLSVANYRFDSGFEEHYRYLELDVDFPTGTGKVTLVYTAGSWVPEKIEMSDDSTQVLLVFSNWDIGFDQIGDLTTLKTLEYNLNVGNAAYEVGQWGDVLEAYNKVVQIDPYYIPGYFFLAYAYGMTDNYLGSVENYQQALMLVPDHHLALNNLAFTYMERGVHLNEAVRLAERAVALERRGTYLDTLGYGYYLLGQYDKALTYLEEALGEVDEEHRAEVEHHLQLVRQALEEGNED